MNIYKCFTTFSVFRVWPDYVKTRLQQTYGYLASGVALTAAAGVAGSRSPFIMSIATRGSLMVSFFYFYFWTLRSNNFFYYLT